MVENAMMSKKPSIKIASLLAFCLLALQCTGRQEARPVPIQFYLEDGVTRLTKGVPFNSVEGFPIDEHLGLIAYQYVGSGADSTSWELFTAANTSRDVRYYSEALRWIPTPDLYSPAGEGHMRFFAFGPRDAVTSVSAVSHAGPALTYTVPSTIADQRGLLVATSDELTYPPLLQELNVSLSLKHVLSGVRFVVGKPSILMSVTVSGVYDQGVYYMNRDRWSSLSKSSTTPSFSITISDYDEDMVAILSPYYRTAPKLTLMMLPQRLPAGAKITFRVRNEYGNVVQETYDIAGFQWEKGKVVTYLIRRGAEGILVFDEFPVFEEETDW